jgi:hypothetical protein
MKTTRPPVEKKAKASIGSYRVEQRQITFRGRVFHFVSYEKDPQTAAWFLMSAGTRWEVAPQIAGEEPAKLDERLSDWLEKNIT